MEKNIKINNLVTKLNRYSSRIEDLKWIMEETKFFFEEFSLENKSSKSIQFNNIFKEYSKLKTKFDEIEDMEVNSVSTKR